MFIQNTEKIGVIGAIGTSEIRTEKIKVVFRKIQKSDDLTKKENRKRINAMLTPVEMLQSGNQS